MITKQSFRACNLIVALLLSVFTLSLTACGDDDSGSGKIVGKWVLDDSYYRFDSNGTGKYHSGGDVWADFGYNTQGGSDGGTVFIRATYVNDKTHGVWKDEYSGSYDTKERTLRIKGKIYTRQ